MQNQNSIKIIGAYTFLGYFRVKAVIVIKHLIDWCFAWSGALRTERLGVGMWPGNHTSYAQKETEIGY